MRGGQGHETCLQVEPFVVGDDNQLCFSHAGNTLNPVPFFPLSRVIFGRESNRALSLFLP